MSQLFKLLAEVKFKIIHYILIINNTMVIGR